MIFLTVSMVKTCKNRHETFELFRPFSIILIDEQNFQRSIPGISREQQLKY